MRWPNKGPRGAVGPAGATGATGATGPSAADLWVWAASTMGNATAVRFLNTAVSNVAAGATEEGSVIIVSAPGNITELRFRISVALATNATITLRVNAVNTALTMTVLAGATTGVVTGSVAIVAGDRISLQTQTVGAEAGTTTPRAVAKWAA